MEQSTRQRMIENITLLWTLNEVPELPKENVLKCGIDETRQLTPERERQLVDNFAFISASTDDMLRVMAVCVEESSDQQGMTIRLASNTGDLTPIVKGFQVIARTLEKAALRVHSRISIRQDLFHHILALCVKRIISRLRSKHAVKTRKTAGKPALADLLSRSINDPSIRSGKKDKANLKRVQSQSSRFCKTFARFEASYDSQAALNVPLDILADLLHQAFEFDTRSLQIALHNASAINPSIKSFLPEAISKLGRYYSVANDLVDAARNSRYTIFRRVLIESLEGPTIVVSSDINGLLGFEAVLERNIGLLYKQRDLQRYSGPLSMARTRFQSRISNCTTTWKIHAEIQLLFFYEQNPVIPLPRIICSSKSACYLCDLFIKSHGKFITPRTHGKLYDKWLLPERVPDQPEPSPRILSAIERFNASVEARISRSLHDRQGAYPQPNESRLQLREPWSSTSTLAQPAPPELDPDQSGTSPHERLEESTGSRGSALILATCGSPVQGASEPIISPNRTTNVIVDGGSSTHEGKPPIEISSLAIIPLPRGHRVGYELCNSASKLVICTEAISLHISWEWDPSTCSPDHERYHRTRWVEVEWLAPDNPPTDGNEDMESIDVDLLDSRSDKIVESISASNMGPLVFKQGEHTITLRRCYEDAPF